MKLSPSQRLKSKLSHTSALGGITIYNPFRVKFNGMKRHRVSGEKREATFFTCKCGCHSQGVEVQKVQGGANPPVSN